DLAQRGQGGYKRCAKTDAPFQSNHDTGNLPAVHSGVAAEGGGWTRQLSSFQNSFQFHSNKLAVSRAEMGSKVNRISQMAIVGPSPEKAGVGGSIPSLATTGITS